MATFVEIFTGFTGILFSASGLVKTTAVKSELTADMEKMFQAYARVFPLAPLGYVPDADFYRTMVGNIEIVLGVLLILGNRRAQKFSALGLLFMMAGATYTNLKLGLYSMAGMSSAFAISMMWIYHQMNKDGK
ncbi:transmembrane protein 35B [Lingula anatina]|uniref:Transmembrane protein 35B n=1 Tax=Lingula anatina TaxID=7574 RepID=A0A1S3HI25_LINAN|nr:transmembrane protein 35B [Lingula anatina]|eukprot:XP_013385760.1 transmembrane protein 35B [Lingula anatina]